MVKSTHTSLVCLGIVTGMVVLLYYYDSGRLLPNTSCIAGGRWHSIRAEVYKKNYSQVHDFSHPMEADFDCVPLKLKDPVLICVYNKTEDRWVSGNIRDYGFFEAKKANYTDKLARRYPEYGFLDIGANLGQYSLIAANAGMKVVAVEPMIENIRRLHKSVNLGGLQDRVTLVTNAVSNIRTNVTLHVRPGNKGGTYVEQNGTVHYWQNEECNGGRCTYNVTSILLNDLLEVITFKKCLMKIDIESFERLAFQHADQLFDKLDIPLVFMEWEFYTEKYFKMEYMTDVNELILFMQKRHYFAYSDTDTEFKSRLPMNVWIKWPNDIIWRKEVW